MSFVRFLKFANTLNFLLEVYDDFYYIGEMLWVLGYHEVLIGNFFSNAAIDELIEPFSQNGIVFDEISVDDEAYFLSITFTCSDQDTSNLASMIDKYPYDKYLLSRFLEPPKPIKDGINFKLPKADNRIVESIQKIENLIEEMFANNQEIILEAIKSKFKELPKGIESLIKNIQDKNKLKEIYQAIDQSQTLNEYIKTI